jgi:hypothetical protein
VYLVSNDPPLALHRETSPLAQSKQFPKLHRWQRLVPGWVASRSQKHRQREALGVAKYDAKPKAQIADDIGGR